MRDRPAIFLDRDGVLNEVVDRADGTVGSPRSPDQLRIAADIESLERLRAAGFLLFVVTNQPDLARGHLPPAALETMHDAIRSRVGVDEIRVCPHDDRDGCACRKPLPGMIVELARHWRVDVGRSWMIGDTWRDMDAARAAGVRPVLLRRAYNADVNSEREARTLGEAVDRILEEAADEQ